MKLHIKCSGTGWTKPIKININDEEVVLFDGDEIVLDLKKRNLSIKENA